MNLPFGLKTCGFSAYAQGERFLEKKRIADKLYKEHLEELRKEGGEYEWS
jgi:hypothetical protein